MNYFAHGPGVVRRAPCLTRGDAAISSGDYKLGGLLITYEVRKTPPFVQLPPVLCSHHRYILAETKPLLYQ